MENCRTVARDTRGTYDIIIKNTACQDYKLFALKQLCSQKGETGTPHGAERARARERDGLLLQAEAFRLFNGKRKVLLHHLFRGVRRQIKPVEASV